MNSWVKFQNYDQQKRISESGAIIEHVLSIGTFQIPFPMDMLVIFPVVHISDSSEHSTRGQLKSFLKFGKTIFSRRYIPSKSYIWKDFKCPVGYMVDEGNWNPFAGHLKSFVFSQLCAIYLRDNSQNTRFCVEDICRGDLGIQNTRFMMRLNFSNRLQIIFSWIFEWNLSIMINKKGFQKVVPS